MTYQEAKYIVDYFPRLMSKVEKQALRQRLLSFKLGTPKNYNGNTSHYERKKKLFIERLGYKDDPEFLRPFDEGYEQFILKTGKRIAVDTPTEYVINRCPSCNEIAKTPYARQCKQCKHRWHKVIAGEFWFEDVFRITNKPYLFIISSKVIGNIEVGHIIDFTGFQLPFKSVIKQFGVATKFINNKRTECATYGIEVDEAQEKLIRKYIMKSAKGIIVLK